MTEQDKQEIRQMIQQEIASSAQKAQYSVTRVPVHTHNNIDSPNVPPHSVIGFQTLTGTQGGVANPEVLNQQILAFGDVTNAGNPQYTNLYQYPLPIIYGDGTTSSDTLTGNLAVGAVSATLTGAYGGSTDIIAVQFNNGEVRSVQFTNGSTALTWAIPLLYVTTSATITLIANARFHGGLAPSGTAVIFRNDADTILQLWVRTEGQTLTEVWSYVDLTPTLAD